VSIVLYGIPNCGTVRRARAWLAGRAVACSFHDFKREGLRPEMLDAWIAVLGWQPLLNRQGLTWRRLAETERARVVDAAGARAAMLAWPSLVKRPVVQWGDGRVSVGFDETEWTARLADAP